MLDFSLHYVYLFEYYLCFAGSVVKDSCYSEEAVTHLAQEFLPNLYAPESSCTNNQDKLFLGKEESLFHLYCFVAC